MKATASMLAAAIAFALPSSTQSAQSGQTASDAISLAMSSAKKKSRHKVIVVRPRAVDSRSPYYLRPGVAPSFGFVGPPGYAGEYAWRKSIGQCVEDLGYGRWAACDSR